jgi:hypothetical protein
MRPGCHLPPTRGKMNAMSSKYLPRYLSLAQKLEAMSMPEPNSGCLLWLGAVTTKGYGTLSFEGVPYYAHHAAWCVAKGDVDEDEDVDAQWYLHKCDVRSCVNSAHIYRGDVQANTNDRMRRNRHRSAVGERNGLSKLNEDQVTAIGRDRRSHRAIGREYGVSHNTIGYIKRGSTWRHVKQETKL